MSIKKYVKKPLNESIKVFFDDFKQIVEQIKGDMLQSIRDQELGKSEQEELMTALEKLERNVSYTLSDTKELKDDSYQYHEKETTPIEA